MCTEQWPASELERFALDRSHGFADRFAFRNTKAPYAEIGAKERDCETWMWIAYGILMVTVLLWTMAQWKLGMTIRNYALYLEKAEQGRRDVEIGIAGTLGETKEMALEEKQRLLVA